ncbi:unnamed protein product [Closterium sp. NIES-65]|nr:unnamed protein product [Closterium sp. NIES-65]
MQIYPLGSQCFCSSHSLKACGVHRLLLRMCASLSPQAGPRGGGGGDEACTRVSVLKATKQALTRGWLPHVCLRPHAAPPQVQGVDGGGGAAMTWQLVIGLVLQHVQRGAATDER